MERPCVSDLVRSCLNEMSTYSHLLYYLSESRCTGLSSSYYIILRGGGYIYHFSGTEFTALYICSATLLLRAVRKGRRSLNPEESGNSCVLMNYTHKMLTHGSEIQIWRKSQEDSRGKTLPSSFKAERSCVFSLTELLY